MKKYGLACCILPALACLLLLLLLILLWAAPDILPPSTEHQDVDLHDLLINAGAFPPGWRIDTKAYKDNTDTGRWGEDNLVIGFSPGDNLGYAYHHVFKFRNPLSAVYGQFWIKQRGLLYPKSGAQPKEWSYRSKKADDCQVKCSEFRCTAMVRYGEFVSVFDSRINEYMSLTDFEYILRAIDDQIATRLNR